MKTLSAVFLLLLLAAHGGADGEVLLAMPLSMFRDGTVLLWGIALFTLLLAISGLYTFLLLRAKCEGEVLVAGFAAGLLVLVALTPSLGLLHGFCALTLLALLFAYHGILLWHLGGPWFLIHLAVPVALAAAIEFHSYGLWQKCVIVYLVLAANVRVQLLRRTPRPAPPRRVSILRRRTVYQLGTGREWKRGALEGSSL